MWCESQLRTAASGENSEEPIHWQLNRRDAGQRLHPAQLSLRAGIKFTGCIEICFANINKEAELGYAPGLFDG